MSPRRSTALFIFTLLAALSMSSCKIRDNRRFKTQGTLSSDSQSTTPLGHGNDPQASTPPQSPQDSQQEVAPPSPERSPAAHNFSQMSDVERGCQNLRSAEASKAIYSVYKELVNQQDQSLNTAVFSKFEKDKNVEGIFHVKPEVGNVGEVVPGYQLKTIFSARHAGIENANSDLFFGIYESNDPSKAPIFAFKGTTAGNSDWENNIKNFGAGLLGPFVGVDKGGQAGRSDAYKAAVAHYFREKASDPQRANTPVIFTGHSLGGSMAEINARYFSTIVQDAGITPPPTRAVIFNALGASRTIKKLGDGIRENLLDQEFAHLETHHFRNQSDPLQKLNKLARTQTLGNTFTLASAAPLDSSTGAYKSFTAEEHLAEAVKSHSVARIVEDLKFSQNQQSARSELSRLSAGDPRTLRELRQDRAKKELNRRGRASAGPSYVETPETREAARLIDGRKFIGMQHKALDDLQNSGNIQGAACTDNS